MTEQDALLSAALLTHRNQLALAEAVQLISHWFQQNGLGTVTQSLQVHMELVVSNARQINLLLERASHKHATLSGGAGEAQTVTRGNVPRVERPL